MRLRALIADDNRDPADLLALLFEVTGAVVRVAYDGADALRQAQGFRPHVGVLDVNMPLVGGLELARERTASSGFDLHLTKPADGLGLVRRVADFYRANYPAGED